MVAWLQFLVCVALIALAGVRLSRYGDVIAEKTGLGRTWVGLVMLATVTSLPELVTGITSVAVAMVPEIAVGDVFGSCVFNLLMIVVLDFLQRGESVYRRASEGHILAGAFGIMLIGFAGFNVALAPDGLHWAVGHVGVYAPVLLLMYAVMMRTVYRFEQRQIARYTGELAQRYAGASLRRALTGYALAALVVAAAGIALPFVARDLAVQMGWSQSFVGTLLVALATSLPEVVVTIAALRLGAVDLAISNLFGSNLFNILVLVVDDLFYLPGPILYQVSSVHAGSALSAIMMTGVAIAGLLYRPQTRVLNTVGWTSLFLFVVYLLNSLVMFLYDRPGP